MQFKIKMKINTIIILFIAIIALLSSCKNAESDINAYFPTVKILSAIKQSDGSVEVKAQIINSGTTVIDFAGFCMDTIQTPKMLNNQIMVQSIDGDIFKATYTSFNPYKRYYFRAWAINNAGYKYSTEIISLDSIIAEPVVAPCSPVINTIKLDRFQPTENFLNVESPTLTNSGWTFRANTDFGTYDFTFASFPTTKIYTVADVPQKLDEVKMSFFSGSNSGSLNKGEKVYVNEISKGNWEITLCNAGWDFNSSTTLYMNGAFKCPQ